MAARSGWATWADVRAVLQTRWQRGDLLRARLAGRPVAPVGVPVRGPTVREVADRFGEVQEWVTQWSGARVGPARVEPRAVGGRLIGANQLPGRVVVDTESDLWAVLGVHHDVRRFDAVVDAALAECPAVLGWVHARPHEAAGLHEQWPRLLAVVRWVLERGGSDTYLRQIDVPGVDTKFVEAHASVLGALLGRVLPAERIDPTAPAGNLPRRFGLRGKQELVRFRPAEGPYRELGVRLADLAAHPFLDRRVVVVENEVSYLAFPSLPDTAVLYGGGYAVSRLAALPWLAEHDVVYWGDLDTHGFRALDRLRRFVPRARSMLMDDETLLAHRDHWGSEPTPVTEHLPLLTRAETGTYLALVHGEYGDRVRLEQERIRFGIVERAARSTW
ncbi:DUF3322 domain-containing protein [Klenkia sp. LSe6-5]|uniref:DUF3322 domain-containing protein n=1 Tax=Klenkia sesuvii TaxID=3103137 RepID=A0ABU8E1Z1_9ACTN